MAQEGASVVIWDFNIAKARAVANEIRAGKGKAMAVKADVTKPSQVKAGIDRVLKRFGKIDILMNNAGIGGMPASKSVLPPPLTNLSDEDWDYTFAVNVKGIFIMCKAVYDHMKTRRSGKIINTSSVAGLRASPTIPHYSASKAAVINFTKSLAEELAPYDIQVNAICPGIIWTPMWEQFATKIAEKASGGQGEINAKRTFDFIVSQGSAVLKKEQTPEDIGWLAVFLASDESRRITGEAIAVEGPTPVVQK
jgi:NAD(P)-dependent dehydrogenase (short-subunit alcohol dehydrogenase family)